MQSVTVSATPSRLAWICATLFLCLLPFAHITAVKEIFFAALLLSCLTLQPCSALKAMPLRGIFTAWILLAILSYSWSIQPAVTAKSIWRDAIKAVLAFGACYVVAFRGLPSRWLGKGLLIASLAFSSLALYDFLTYKTWQGPHTPPRYDVSVTLLAFMAMLFLNFEPAGEKTPQLYRAGTTLSLCLALGTGILSASRSFALAMMLGAATLALVYFRHVSAQHRKLLGWGLVIGLTLPLLLYALTNTERSLSHTQDREILYGTVTKHALQSPWTGTGFGHETNHRWYAETFPHIAGGDGLAAATHAHNIVLSYLEQLGLPGVLLILLIFYNLANPCLKAAQSTSPSVRRLGAVGLLLILGTFISNTFNFYFARHHLLLFMGLSGVVLGWIKRADLPAAPSNG